MQKTDRAVKLANHAKKDKKKRRVTPKASESVASGAPVTQSEGPKDQPNVVSITPSEKNGLFDSFFAPIVTINMDETFPDVGFGLTFTGDEEDWFVEGYVEPEFMPKINLDENPSPIAILTFLQKLKGLVKTKRMDILQLIYDSALLGPMEQGWAREANFEFSKIEQMFLNWMWRTTSWNQTMFDLREGKRFDDNLTTHISIFNLVAKHMGLRAEDELTKFYFAKSVGMNPMWIFDGSGNLRTFEGIVILAKQNELFKTQPSSTEETEASAPIKPGMSKEFSDRRTHHCTPHLDKGGKRMLKKRKPHR